MRESDKGRYLELAPLHLLMVRAAQHTRFFFFRTIRCTYNPLILSNIRCIKYEAHLYSAPDNLVALRY